MLRHRYPAGPSSWLPLGKEPTVQLSMVPMTFPGSEQASINNE